MSPSDTRLFPKMGVVVMVFVLGFSIIRLVERMDWIPERNPNLEQSRSQLANTRLIPVEAIAAATNRVGLKIKDGQNVITVFTDYECPYCRKFHQSMIPLFEGVGIRYRNMPLGFHTDAMDRAILVECTKQASGDLAASELIHWIFGLNMRVAKALDVEIPVVAGQLVQDEALQCFHNPQSTDRLAVEEALRLDSIAVAKLNLVGTPSSVIGDVVIIGGYSNLQIDQIFDNLAKR